MVTIESTGFITGKGVCFYRNGTDQSTLTGGRIHPNQLIVVCNTIEILVCGIISQIHQGISRVANELIFSRVGYGKLLQLCAVGNGVAMRRNR